MLGHRTISVGVCHQKFGDCGIYSITNVFMREIVLLLGWRGITETEINWSEDSIDNCSEYLQSGRDRNLYKYCILYTFIQRLLRKYFGSCGIQTQKVMSAFCKEFNSIIENLHEWNKTPILTDLNAETIKIDMEQLVAQYQVYIRQLRSSRNPINDPQMLADCLRRLKEITYTFDETYLSGYISGLEEIFTAIKVALKDNIFTAKSVLLTPYPQGEDPFGPGDTETVREYTFQKGKYGVISVSYDELFSSTLLNFSLVQGENANLVNEIVDIVQELDRMYDESIFEELPISKTKNKKQKKELDLNLELNEKMEKYFNTRVVIGSGITTTIRANIARNIARTLDTTKARNLDKHHAMTVKYMFSFTDISGKTYICIVCKNTWGTGNAFGGLNILILETIPKAIFRYFEIIPKIQAPQEMAVSDDVIDSSGPSAISAAASASASASDYIDSDNIGSRKRLPDEDAEPNTEENIEPIIRRYTKPLVYIDEDEEVASSNECLQVNDKDFQVSFKELLSRVKLSQEEEAMLLEIFLRDQVKAGGQKVKLTKRRRKYKRQTYKKRKLSKPRRTYKRKIYKTHRNK
jgi:hypothetical protein